MIHPFKHMKTVIRHKWAVGRYCWRIGLYWQGITHDLSKFSCTEFLPSARFFQGNRSPIEAERELYGVSRAWLHHKGRNRHHLEYWTDYDLETREYRGCPMPLNYIAESICDRVGASRVYHKETYSQAFPLAFYKKDRPTSPVHADVDELFLYYLNLLAERGEDFCFFVLREDLRLAKAAYKAGNRAFWFHPKLGETVQRREIHE